MIIQVLAHVIINLIIWGEKRTKKTQIFESLTMV